MSFDFGSDSDDELTGETKMNTGKGIATAAAAAAVPVAVAALASNLPSAPPLPTEVPRIPSPSALASKARSKAKQVVEKVKEQVHMRMPSFQKDSKFWSDHVEWQRQVLLTNWQSAVKNPIKTTGFGSFVSYEVALSPMGYTVRRRYSDFVWLQDILQRRYVGILISPLPPKAGVMGKKGFLKLRMRHLNIFLSKLISNPYLRSDTSLMDFFSVGEKKQWSATKKSAVKEQSLMMAKQLKGDSSESASAIASKPNIGQTKWVEAIDTYDLPDNTDTTIRRVQQQVVVLERLMKGCIKSSNKLVQRSHQYAEEMGEFNVAFQALVHTEQSTTAQGGGTPELSSILSKMGYMFSSWHQVLKFQPGVNQMLLHEVLNFELRTVQCLQDLFKQRESMTTAAAKAQVALTNVELKKQAFLSRGKAKEAEKMGSKVSQALLTLKRCTYVVNFMTKGLFYSELERFTSDKVKAFREMMAQFAAAHAAYAKRLHEQWCLSLDSVEDHVDKDLMIQKANSTLEDLDMSAGIEIGEDGRTGSF